MFGVLKNVVFCLSDLFPKFPKYRAKSRKCVSRQIFLSYDSFVILKN